VPLVLATLQGGLLGLAQNPSSTALEAAQRLADVIVGWASQATAGGVPCLPPVAGPMVAILAAGGFIEAALAAFWPTLIFPGATAPPAGPPLVNPLKTNTPDALTAATVLATAMDVNAHLQMVTFPGAPPVVVPIV
jgi:hypothetical protein